MIDKELLDILVCPENHTPLAVADQELLDRLNKDIAAGTVKNRGGKAVETPLQGGLVRADGAFLYPIVDGIPVMLIDEAIPV